ncbi:MAG: RHS repeat protein [Nitrosomonadaceae bacterium]|nr:RHS repeat protein [Nitrosomonadaceae bacterium]
MVGSAWINQQASGDTLTQLKDTAGNSAGWRLITADDTTEYYNASRNLLFISSHNGHVQMLKYDSMGRLTKVSDNVGRSLIFTYDSFNRVTTVTDPAGGIYQYAYDSVGNLTSVTFPDGRARTYHYNESAYTSGASLPNALTGITDENGVRFATYTYDAQGRAVVTEHAGSLERYVLSYSTDGSYTRVTDPLGSQYTHHFQTILGIARSTGQSQPAGSGCSAASSTTTYDVNGNVTSRADFNGNKTCYAYDLSRNLEITRVEGVSVGSNCPGDLASYTPAPGSNERKILTDWHANFRLPVKITEAGRETGYVYDTYGNVSQYQIKDTATSDTRTWSTSYVYHSGIPGVILQKIEDGPRTDVADITTTDYYVSDAACAGGHSGCRGQIASITNALGHTTQITRYNAQGQPEEIIEPNGLITNLTYDVRQRLLSRTVGTEITRYQYDGVGQLKKVTLPDGSFLNYNYDAAHRLTGIADNLGNRMQYTLDNMGNRIKEELFDSSNNLARIQQREFDALSRLWKDIGAQSQTTQYQYDAQGNLKQITDPLLHTATYQFDTRNRLKGTIDPANGHIQQTLDARDQITRISDPLDIATTYTYNGFGDVIQEVSADRGTTAYTYDSAGNLKTVLDARGVKHTYSWDALNRPIQRAHSVPTGVAATASIAWSYDAGPNGIGRLTGMTDESGSTAFGYDPYGRLLTKTQTVKLVSGNGTTINYIHTLSYQYDSFGRLSQTTYPSGTQVATSYGDDGRPVEIRVNGELLIGNIAYQPFGEPKSWVWGNGQVYTRSFDLDGRIKTHPAGSDTRTLIYDPASRITQTTGIDPMHNRSYDYDALNRLTSQSDNSGFKLWNYDANSNRTQAQFGAAGYPYSIASDSNHLMTVAGPVAKTYSYDAAGYPLSDGIATFTWNAAGKLSAAVKSGKMYVYKYNALDQRIIKNGPLSPKFFFFYDPNGQLIGEYRDDATTVQPDDWLVRQETVWLDNIPVAVIKKPTATAPIQIHYIHTDHLNTPRVIVNRNNVVVWRWEDIHAFGANLANESPMDATQVFEYNLRFSGQYFDKETNLHYNYFRYYEPETGRYISPDPIGLAGGMNVWGYAYVNSMKFVDPLGLASCTYSISAGSLICIPDNPVNSAVDISVASGNNGRGMRCKNNPECINIPNRGPIPIGLWTWNINGPGAANTKPNGRRLIPAKGTNTYNRSGFLTHSCVNAFGPSLGPTFCSEGCITGSADSMQQLNQLLDAEPTSTLNVME